ncbi:MAG: dihydropteroate synthase [Bacteroidia bacterium]|nr:dihydropteroate synthase [Bacteroidia bacterium]
MQYTFGHKKLSLLEPSVMGIVNITPDSFYKNSRAENTERVIEHVAQMIHEGAAVIDLGAQSTRPGAAKITAEEELTRLIPALQAVRSAFPDHILSVDTFYTEVAGEAIRCGADIINDVMGASTEGMTDLIAKADAGYVLMHIQGEPATMQQHPEYRHVKNEVFSFLESTAQRLTKSGIRKLFLDPGFGFGKSLEHNYELLAGLNKLCSLPYPVLTGLSRKSMVTNVLEVTAEDALNGTSILHWIALEKGARILRVHDVKAAAQVIKIHNFITNQKRTGV